MEIWVIYWCHKSGIKELECLSSLYYMFILYMFIKFPLVYLSGMVASISVGIRTMQDVRVCWQPAYIDSDKWLDSQLKIFTPIATGTNLNTMCNNHLLFSKFHILLRNTLTKNCIRNINDYFLIFIMEQK